MNDGFDFKSDFIFPKAGLTQKVFNLSQCFNRLMNTGKYKIGMVKAMAQYITIFCFPGMMEWLPSYFQMFNSPAIEFFVKIIRSQIESRKKQDSAAERRNDMIDLVVQALEEGGSKSFKDQKAFETAAIAQIFILFFAGFDTASTASALTR